MTTQLSADDLANLGPLAHLLGTWEGDKGDDFAPGPDRGPSTNLYRERMTFSSIGRVDNHEQILYGLAYATKAWRLGVDNAFHEDTGYFLWDAARKTVVKAFVVPRGVSVLAGGTSEATATSFEVGARVGSPTFGILSSPFLDEMFKTTAYTLKIGVDGDALHYDAMTMLAMPGRAEFPHRDHNTLRRVP